MPKTSKLWEVPWVEKTGLSLRWKVRTIKMIAADCPKGCQKRGGDWWESCKHDPYFHMAKAEDVMWDDSSGFTRNEDGTYTPAEPGEVVYVRVPNVRQVAFTTRVRSRLGVQAQLARGWRHPKDVDPGIEGYEGIAPMCEFNNCYASNPTVKTSAGNYCSPIHAKAVLIKERGITEEVYDKQKQRDQLEAVSLS